MSGLPASPLDVVSGSEVLQHPNIAADTSSGADLRAAKEKDERRALSARQAALARAADADREAALAQQERDAAEARVPGSALLLLLPNRRRTLVRLALTTTTTSHLHLCMLLFSTTRQLRC